MSRDQLRQHIGHPADRKAAAELMREGRARHSASGIPRKEWNEFVKIVGHNFLARMTSIRKDLARERAAQTQLTEMA